MTRRKDEKTSYLLLQQNHIDTGPCSCTQPDSETWWESFRCPIRASWCLGSPGVAITKWSAVPTLDSLNKRVSSVASSGIIQSVRERNWNPPGNAWWELSYLKMKQGKAPRDCSPTSAEAQWYRFEGNVWQMFFWRAGNIGKGWAVQLKWDRESRFSVLNFMYAYMNLCRVSVRAQNLIFVVFFSESHLISEFESPEFPGILSLP